MVRQVKLLVRRSVTVEDATAIVGLSEDHLKRFWEEVNVDDDVALALVQARRLLDRECFGKLTRVRPVRVRPLFCAPYVQSGPQARSNRRSEQ